MNIGLHSLKFMKVGRPLELPAICSRMFISSGSWNEQRFVGGLYALVNLVLSRAVTPEISLAIIKLRKPTY
jgi:hypothetical protein